jgi:hypothetical protein
VWRASRSKTASLVNVPQQVFDADASKPGFDGLTESVKPLSASSASAALDSPQELMRPVHPCAEQTSFDRFQLALLFGAKAQLVRS